jgi:hypothetical protein
MSSTLVVMAGGYGSRYGGIKQLQGLGPSHETIIDYSVYDALLAGFSGVVVVVRSSIRQEMADGLVQRWRDRARIQLAIQEPRSGALAERGWGTAHAVLAAADLVPGAFAVVNADDFYGRAAMLRAASSCEELQQFGRLAPARCAVVAFPLHSTMFGSEPVSRAVLRVDGDGLLAGIEEMRIQRVSSGGTPLFLSETGEQITPDAPVSMNMWAFMPTVFPQLRAAFRDFLRRLPPNAATEFLLPHFVQQLVRTGAAQVKVESGDGTPAGLTHRSENAHMQNLFRQHTDHG